MFFAPTEYNKRHYSVAKIIHQELALKFKLGPADRVPYYKYKPEVILENNEYRLYWDRTVLTDQRVTNNRPDLIFTDKRSKKTMLIDVAIPNNNNLREKHNEKILKYRDLQEQVRRQWQMQWIETIPIVLSSTGVIPKSLLESIRKLDLDTKIIRNMQKAVVLATARSVRKFMGDNATNVT